MTAPREAARATGALRRLLAGVFLLCVAGLLGCERATLASSSAGAPHVLLVTIDTLRADHLSAYGYARTTSPNLDQLAAQGALFETVYAPMSTTGPSHATIFTARYPLAHGVVRNGIALGNEPPTLPELLQARGYRTAAFVSSYPVSHRFGFARGFAHYDDDFASGGSVAVSRWSKEDVEGGFDRLGADTVDRALAWVASQPDGEPRFVWVHLFDPHAPYGAPPPYGAAFADGEARGVQVAIDAYDGEILYADAQLARLVDGFRVKAGSRELLTVITSDHGEAFGEHGWQGHNRNVFDEEVRVPLIIHWPGRISAGTRIAAPVHLVDLLPTVVAASGGTPPGTQVDGIDLLPALVEAEPLDAERALYLQRPDFRGRRSHRKRRLAAHSFAVRRGGWKLIERRKAEGSQLFDLERDPGERSDVAGREIDRAAALAAQIADWRRAELAKGGVRAVAPVAEDVERKLRALGYAD